MKRYKFVITFLAVSETEIQGIIKDDDLSLVTSTGLEFRKMLIAPNVKFVSCNVYDNLSRKFISISVDEFCDVLAVADKIKKLQREGGEFG